MSSEHSGIEVSSGSSTSKARVKRSARTGQSSGARKGKSGGSVAARNESSRIVEKTIAGFACPDCDQQDTESMVQCDECDEWFHFACAGVTSEIADRSWSCAKCSIANGVQQISVSNTRTSAAGGPNKHNRHGPTGAKKKIPVSSTPSAHEAAQVLLQHTKHQQSHKALEHQCKNKPEGMSFFDISPIESGVLRSAAGHRTSRAPSTASSRMSQQALAKLKLQKLEEKRELNQREAEKERLYLIQKYNLLEEMASAKGSDAGSVASKRIEEWVQQTSNVDAQGGLIIEPPGQFDPRQCSTKNRQTEAVPQEHRCGVHANIGEISFQRAPPLNTDRRGSEAFVDWRDQRVQPAEERFPPSRQNTFVRRSSLTRGPHLEHNNTGRQPGGVEMTHPVTPTQQQLTARQSVSRDLPVFSGNPEEWPIFLSLFNSTTSMCGYSNEENVIRLQKCLKGKAYDAVRSRLLHASNVPGVIATLKMLFGQPEAIIQSLIVKINALPPLREDKLETVVDFAVNVENFVATVEACDLEEHIYNISLLHQLVNKLPPTIKLDWARYRCALPNVNLATFGRWIYSLAEAASTVTVPVLQDEMRSARNVRSDAKMGKKGNAFLNSHSEIYSPDSPLVKPSDRFQSKTFILSTDICPICKGACKTAEKCKRFQDLSRESRWAAVREFGLCRKCLRRHNGACKAKTCGKNGCTFKHHEMLHKDQVTQSADTSPTVETNPQASASRMHSCNVHGANTSTTFFRYLPVTLSSNNKAISTYAFFDEGSELTLVDQELADELNLEGIVSPLCLRWTGGDHRSEKNSRVVNLSIAGIRSGAKTYHLSGARTVRELLLPYQTLDVVELTREYPHLEGLPIDSYSNARPRILIGLKHASIGLVQRCVEGKPEDPIATKTRLGWAVFGGYSHGATLNMVHYTFHVCASDQQSDETLHMAMKEYFDLDSVGITKKNSLLSKDDNRALSLLQSLTKFEKGRYETGLLWKFDDVRLPDNREMALRRYYCLQKRMQQDQGLTEALNQQIANYLAKGYLRKLSPEELGLSFPRVWYLPMFPVTNPKKPGKIRLVWDAAATAFGVSLNSVLVKGPDQLSSLFAIHIQFRQFRVGLTGDIREMFHQVNIRCMDQHCQRMFWTDENGELAIYVLCVMTFGACCSSSCAQYVKNINADRFGTKYPLAVEAIQKRHYVDDMLVSVETEEEAITLAQELKLVHSEGGFDIRNWLSNSQLVMTALQENSVIEKNMNLNNDLATEKILGMWWRTSTDSFTYKIGWNRFKPGMLSGELVPTKREVLRVLMSIFDPLGLIGHFLIFLKIILQDIWRSKIDWDEQISGPLLERWHMWLAALPMVEEVDIPRCFRTRTSLSNYLKVQMHTFVDASDSALAAVVYLRFAQGNVIECMIVAAKTRVASLKLVSIPRLELQAALIGARLAETITQSLSIPISRHFYWTDSRDVMCWINSDHRRYSQFVGFRISEILELTESREWNWIQSKENVADMGTKWKNFPDLSTNSKWFKGPGFLWRSDEQWLRSTVDFNTETEEELRPSLNVHCTIVDPVIRIERFSTWRRLHHVVVFVYRFSKNCQLCCWRQPKMTGPFTMDELRKAEDYLIRQAQQYTYSEEIVTLRNLDQQTGSLPKSSSLFKLTPWLDANGILRMRGRIAACEYVTYDAKNPIIMPRHHHLTRLIITDYHHRYHHKNHETVVNELRQKYRIPRVRSAYYTARKSCQKCKNESSVPRPPIMADLPQARLAAYSRPFTFTGIDYFGPVDVVVNRKREKRWGMIATCLTVRAIHIEVVHSLTTDSCIMAIRNFIARRGTPCALYSDRGTNFVGANRVLTETTQAIDHDVIMKEFFTSKTTWHFNPPAAPHMGGSWERLVRSVKSNLLAICPGHRLTDEILRNLLAEVEITINSRPLTHVPVDDESAEALTPNHFLLGSSNGLKPLTTLGDFDGAALRQNFRASQVIANIYWKRWITDYLPEITRRTKWYDHSKPIAIGDIVIIADPRLPRNCWPKGKVIATCAGKDSQIRAATVQTANGVYERPTAKLAVLDVRREGQ